MAMESGESTRVAAAARLAAERHAGQVRKGRAGAPYVAHLREVAELVAGHGGSEDAVVAAWLHDSVEDTATTLPEIAERFGDGVAAIVAELSDDPRMTKAEANAEQVRSAPCKSPAAALIKAADQTSNLRGIAEDPPDWTAERRAAYVAKARAVVAGLPAPGSIKAVFAAAAKAAEGAPGG
jgi:(p)ppGpp synthase/HD superfamily hydrolase